MADLIIPPHVAKAREQERLATVIHPRRCGTCWYSVDVTDTEVRCEGLPPTPLVLGAVQTAGGVEPNIVLYRPNLPKALRRCSLWEARDIEGSPTTQERAS